MKKHIVLSILLATLFSIVVPQRAEAGAGGYVTLVNGTRYTWERYVHTPDDMNAWGFPQTIPAGATSRVYIEFDEIWNSLATVKYRGF